MTLLLLQVLAERVARLEAQMEFVATYGALIVGAALTVLSGLLVSLWRRQKRHEGVCGERE